MQRKLQFSEKQSEEVDLIFQLMKNELDSRRVQQSKLYDFDFDEDKPSENPKRFFWEKGFIRESENNSDSSINSSYN